MRCERCQGTGTILIIDLMTPRVGINGEQAPCPDCNGTGITHCCDGLCEQPEREEGE